LIDFTEAVIINPLHKNEEGVNPMVAVFNTMPSFQNFLRDENSFEDHFWNE
jgi:hypothetical protein